MVVSLLTNTRRAAGRIVPHLISSGALHGLSMASGERRVVLHMFPRLDA